MHRTPRRDTGDSKRLGIRMDSLYGEILIWFGGIPGRKYNNSPDLHC